MPERVLISSKPSLETSEVRKRRKKKTTSSPKMVPRLADSGIDMVDRLKLDEDLNSSDDEFDVSITHTFHRQRNTKHINDNDITNNKNCDENGEIFDANLQEETEFIHIENVDTPDNYNEEDTLLNQISEKIIDNDISEENSLMIALQVFFPFCAAGFGTVAAGLLLDKVQVYFYGYF